VSRFGGLALRSVSKSFDGFRALDSAQFEVRRGEVHALLGENGAGKSTLMNIAAGLYAPQSGEVLIDEQAVVLRGPLDAARHGIGMVHQHFKLVRPFTVLENLALTVPFQGGYRQRLTHLRERVLAKAGEVGFMIDPDARIDQLSIAEQQRVEILKVLMAGATILILDEPTAVLTDQEAQGLLQTVRALARSGSAVVLVTHKMNDVKQFADRVTVMRAGKTVGTVDPATISMAALVEMTVGATSEARAPAQKVPGAVRLRLKNVRSQAVAGEVAMLKGLDLEVRAGEVLGLAGVGGNGQSELAAAIMGLDSAIEGSIEMDGQALRAGDAGQRRDLKMAFIPADRQALALAQSLSIAENFAIGQVQTGAFGSAMRLSQAAMDQAAGQAIATFDVQGVRSLKQKAALLSGGNAQKLVLAREFGKQPRFILAHSPSRGLDVRATAQVHERLLAARQEGCAVLLISEDLDEVLALSDRIAVMARGKVVAQFEAHADRQVIGAAMVSHGH
jgi:general nucleoside transport system ATP-binding protein